MIQAQDRFKNYGCDGSHCRKPDGMVKLYPLTGGANLILCIDCFSYENQYNALRNRSLPKDSQSPIHSWGASKEYKT